MGCNSKYKVCIRCDTYNHSQFIVNAMDGFVSQETSFPFVATIIDDASTDNTSQVIVDYLDRYFDFDEPEVAFRNNTDYGSVLFARHKLNKNCFFAILLLNENHYSQRKRKNPYLKPWVDNSEYIALCEGDDYWIDSAKLEKQVTYLDTHEECEMIACSSYWSIEGVLEERNYASKEPRVLSVEEVIRGGGSFVPTCSLVYKRRYFYDIPQWRKIANVGDYPLQIQGALEGNLFYLPEAMCVYRRGQKGSWADRFYNNQEMRLKHQRAELTWMAELDRSTKHRFQSVVFERFIPSIHILFVNHLASVKEYYHCVKVAGTASDKKRMIKNVTKRLIHYKQN